MAVLTQSQARDIRMIQLGFPSVFAEELRIVGSPSQYFYMSQNPAG